MIVGVLEDFLGARRVDLARMPAINGHDQTLLFSGEADVAHQHVVPLVRGYEKRSAHLIVTLAGEQGAWAQIGILVAQCFDATAH